MPTQIYIFEDDITDANSLYGTIASVAEKRQISVTVSIFSHANDLLHAIESHEPNLLFMDIDAGRNEPDGISLARRIREWSADLPIVFVTYLQECALLGYEVQAMHYLTKPATEQEVEVCFDRLEKLTGRRLEQSPTIPIVSDYRTLEIPVENIRYAEVNGNTVTFHLSSGREITSNMSLSSLADQVGGAMLKCNRNYLVNPKYIARIEGNDFVLVSREHIPIRINGRKNTIDQYHDWLMRHMSETL